MTDLTLKEEKEYNNVIILLYKAIVYDINISKSLDGVYDRLTRNEYENVINALNNSIYLDCFLNPKYKVHEAPEFSFTPKLTAAGMKYAKNLVENI